MASMKLEEQLDEQPPEKKSCIDNFQKEGGNASNPNDSELQKSAEGNKESELPTMTNDEDKPAEAASTNSKKNREEGNDLLDLELENLSREEFIKLVRKQMETAKKEAEESANAKQQAKEMTTKVEELKRAVLASQHKVEGLTEEMANLNAEHQKHLDSAKITEEFSQRIVNLEQEKAEVHADLHQKMAEIVDMHKEVEDKSKELAEKAKQIDALLMQLNESTSHQPQMPTEQQMKIQLSLETWYDWLGFVPRHQLWKIVPKIGDRKFASIIQKFLHEYGEISIHYIQIVAPYEEDPSGPHPRVRAWQNHSLLRFEMAEAQMPANIKNFAYIELSYFDQSVLDFMQKFQQNGLLDNVNLTFDKLSSKDIQPVMSRILPLINGIVSIYVSDSTQLVDFYDAGNSKEILEMNMKMMEKTRYLGTGNDAKSLHANRIDLYCHWLYQTARPDGKPRVLILEQRNVDSAPICLFIDRLKQDFLMATVPVSFFIRINLRKALQPLEGICLDNDKTKERLLTKMEEVEVQEEEWEEVLLISRCPLGSTKKWIEENEKEVLDFYFDDYHEKTIYLSQGLKVVPI